MNEFNKFEGNKKSEPALEKNQYNFEAIANLEEPIYSLLKKNLKKSIDKGEYNVLIGDDASGRIPTLIFRKIMLNRLDKLRSNLKSEERDKLLQTYFVAGSANSDNEKEVTDFFRKISSGDKYKALLVTEFMGSGESMEKMTRGLEEAGIQCDAAVLGTENSEMGYRIKYPEMFSRHRFYMIDTSGASILIYNRPTLAGVKKMFPKNAHAEPVRKFEEFNNAQDDIIKAREDVDKIAKVVLKTVWGEK